MNENFRVLGVDPGLERTGWAVIEKKQRGEVSICAVGLIKTSPTHDLQIRLAKIYDELSLVVGKYLPCEAAVEEIYFTKRTNSQTSTTYARGIILLALHKASIKTAHYNPTTVKSMFCGNGSADKNQMIKTAMLVFSLRNPLKPDDVSDAAAIAFVHLKNKSFHLAMERGSQK